MKRVFAAIALVLAAVAGVMIVRTMGVVPPAVAESGVPALPPAPIDTAAAAAHLAGALKFATVSLSSGGPIDTAAFLGLHGYLATTYPRIHATLRRETVAGLSLVYTWSGADTTLAPAVIMGHLDVVPVPEVNRSEWTHAPFSGDISDGFVWGRGALDDKSTVFAVMEAVEALLATGYRPPRTVYLTFGHDEEVGGRYGARKIVEQLVSRGVKPAIVLDEGGFMGTGILPGIAQRAAVVGIAEKGYVSLRLTAKAEGGHSSMPTERTAVGALSRAVAALEATPFPSSLDGPSEGMVRAMAPWLPFGQRLALANLWLTRPLVLKGLQSNPLSAALTRTTTAPTMLNAGVKDNVLPPEAEAVVNFRIRPGETVQSVRERVIAVVNDTLVTVALLDSVGVDPSPVSGTDSPAWTLLQHTIQSMTSGEAPPVIPYLVMGGTDAKFWGPHSDRVYRFLPIPLGDGDRARVHGVNERVGVSDFATSVDFFARLLRGLDRL
ncbi:MAG: M20/M25/M40 family metallo-hydrolase [Gemmatimonadaceae bacterium]|nr:M20/M25/M40 family metallo-hydrolase [Gemmatimonadaceae bacterium]